MFLIYVRQKKIKTMLRFEGKIQDLGNINLKRIYFVLLLEKLMVVFSRFPSFGNSLKRSFHVTN